jgi:hypothetical protein
MNFKNGCLSHKTGGGNIDGVATHTLGSNKFIEVISDGSNWYIIGSN